MAAKAVQDSGLGYINSHEGIRVNIRFAVRSTAIGSVDSLRQLCEGEVSARFAPMAIRIPATMRAGPIPAPVHHADSTLCGWTLPASRRIAKGGTDLIYVQMVGRNTAEYGQLIDSSPSEAAGMQVTALKVQKMFGDTNESTTGERHR